MAINMQEPRSTAIDSQLARFGALERLYGAKSMERLRQAHVCVIGIGGVGSWTAESLARSGVGELTLIDADDVCITNINRQCHALTSTVGGSKVKEMANRIKDISPDCEVNELPQFITPGNASLLDGRDIDLVVDATDRMSVKAAILDACRQRQITTVTIGGAGGRTDATQINVADFASVGRDDLLRMTRRMLRRDYGWEKGEGHHYGVSSVFSTERIIYPAANGTVCDVPEPGASLRMDCATGLGAVCHVTATFGLIAAGESIRLICISDKISA